MKRFFVFAVFALVVAVAMPAVAETWVGAGVCTGSDGFGFVGGQPTFTLDLEHQGEHSLFIVGGDYSTSDKEFGSATNQLFSVEYYHAVGGSRLHLGGGVRYSETSTDTYTKDATRAELGVVVNTDVRYSFAVFGPVDDPNDMKGLRAQAEFPLFPRAQASSLSFATSAGSYGPAGVPADESRHVLRLEGVVGDFKANDGCLTDCVRATDARFSIFYVYRMPFGSR